MTTRSTREELREELKNVANEIGYLWLQHDVFWKTMTVMNNNQRVMKIGGDLQNWMKNAFIESASIGFRRQLDRDPRTVSLMSVLRKLLLNNEAFTRDGFQRMIAFPPGHNFHKSDKWNAAGEEFDEMFGNGDNHLAAKVVDDDIELIKTEGASIKEQADKEFAHSDKKEMTGAKATGTDLEKCLTHLDELVVKYIYLLTGQRLGPLRPVFAYDFEEVFTFPWLERKSEQEALSAEVL